MFHRRTVKGAVVPTFRVVLAFSWESLLETLCFSKAPDSPKCASELLWGYLVPIQREPPVQAHPAKAKHTPPPKNAETKCHWQDMNTRKQKTKSQKQTNKHTKTRNKKPKTKQQIIKTNFEKKKKDPLFQPPPFLSNFSSPPFKHTFTATFDGGGVLPSPPPLKPFLLGGN